MYIHICNLLRTPVMRIGRTHEAHTRIRKRGSLQLPPTSPPVTLHFPHLERCWLWNSWSLF